MSAHTPGPWGWEYTGDGKRITIGEGLVEGPNGYEVAEVYSDDCPRELAEANARLIAAAPELAEASAPAIPMLEEYASSLREFQSSEHLAPAVDAVVAALRAALAKAGVK